MDSAKGGAFMRTHVNKTRVVVMVVATAALLYAGVSADENKAGIGHMGMTGMMDSMDDMMGTCSEMMKDMDTMMGEKMSGGCMGMMDMRSMGMMMHEMSQNMKAMMEHMDSMVKNDTLMNDPEMKVHAGKFEEQMGMMTESMQEAMKSLEKMTERMGNIESE